MFFNVYNPAVNDPIVKWISNITNYEFKAFTWWVILIRLFLSIGLGAIIGAERANKSHAAGLRTYILVSLGASVGMMTNLFLYEHSDTSRIGAGVISGIGFIGAGTIIITSRNQVRGLTTAAALWACACSGLAFGAGYYTLGLISTLLIIIVVMFMPKIEGALQKNTRTFDIHVELFQRTDLKKLLEVLRNNNLQVRTISYDPAYANSGLSVYTLGIHSEGSKKEYMKKTDVLNLMLQLEYINFCEAIEQ